MYLIVVLVIIMKAVSVKKEEILNKIPVFLAKTYRIIDVALLIVRILSTSRRLSGARTERGSSSRTSPG